MKYSPTPISEFNRIRLMNDSYAQDKPRPRRRTRAGYGTEVRAQRPRRLNPLAELRVFTGLGNDGGTRRGHPTNGLDGCGSRRENLEVVSEQDPEWSRPGRPSRDRPECARGEDERGLGAPFEDAVRPTCTQR